MKSRLSSWPCAAILRFSKRETGSLTILSLFIFMAMLIVCGTAVDLMLHERKRNKIQSVLDVAVLAAASATQTRDRETVIDDYLTAFGLNPDDFAKAVGGDTTNLSADALGHLQTGTMFMKMVGYDSLNSAIASSAIEAISAVEISLVLDLSGTMRGERLANLRTAVSSFLDAVYGVDCVEDGNCTDSVTVNVIPYSGSVNPGPVMAAYTGLQDWHSWSSCAVLRPSSYDELGLPMGSTQQYPHYNMWHVEDTSQELAYGWCPKAENEIMYAETNPQKIKDFVNGLQMFDGTGTDIGMKWGVSLLTPSSRDAMDQLIVSGDITGIPTGSFPRDYSTNVLKVVVLMTDGMITPQLVPQPVVDGAEHLNFDFDWLYDEDGNLRDAEDPSHLDKRLEMLVNYGDSASVDEIEASSSATRAAAFDNPYVPQNTALENLNAQCGLAHSSSEGELSGITVYSIRFLEDSEWTEEYMRNCASAPSHFFDVQDMDIESAFDTIASHINFTRLRLTN